MSKLSKNAEKSDCSSAMSSILEFDLFYLEVLPRLPLKSLLRLKCVCKTLKAAISSPEFVKHYLHGQYLLVLSSDTGRVSCYDIDSPPRLPISANFTRSVQSTLSNYVVGSSNGLLCVYDCLDRGCRFILLNPSTRIYRAVKLPLPLYTRQLINYGFGFDHENHDYKIVSVCDQIITSESKIVTVTRTIKVYSLISDSWRVVETTLPTKDSVEGINGVVVINNHLLHWLFWYTTSRPKRRIGCFDICSEKWKDDVLLPAYYYDLSHTNFLLKVGVLDGCLSSSFENRDDSSFDVWVMKEYGVQDSWVKLLSIPVSNDLKGGVFPIFCCSASGVVLIRQRNSSRLFWYNMLDNGLTEVVADQAPDFASREAYTCRRSLVTIPGGVLYEELPA